MAELEGEIFQLGKWKSIDELEESISLQELTFILEHKRKAEQDNRKFLAAIQGIDIDKHAKDPVQERIEEVKRRAAVRTLGEQEVEKLEYAELGFGFETE